MHKALVNSYFYALQKVKSFFALNVGCYNHISNIYCGLRSTYAHLPQGMVGEE